MILFYIIKFNSVKVMKRIESIKEIQKIETEELKYFDKLCRDNQLKYFLAGGTLLGTVRHKGFIPWDDDIDIAMPREDYQKLLQLNVNERYKIISIENNRQYIWPFAKLIDTTTYVRESKVKDINEYGLFIDVFPLDGLGNNKIIARVNEFIIRFLRGRLAIITNGNGKCNSILKNLIQNHYTRMGKEKVYNKILKYATKHNFYKSKYVGSVVGGARGKKEIFKYEVYSETTDMPFENLTLKGMKYYDEYLSRMYGNYMELPPEDKRGGFHTIECYYREEGE